MNLHPREAIASLVRNTIDKRQFYIHSPLLHLASIIIQSNGFPLHQCDRRRVLTFSAEILTTSVDFAS